MRSGSAEQQLGLRDAARDQQRAGQKPVDKSYLLFGPQCFYLSAGLRLGVFFGRLPAGLDPGQASLGGEGTVVGSRKQWVVKTGR